MRIQNRRIETFIFLTGLLMAITPMAVTLAVRDHFPTTAKDSKYQYETSDQRNNTESVEFKLLSPTFVRSSDFPSTIQHRPTIRWKFMKEYGVWGVKFHSFSLPYSNGCITDYFFIQDLINKTHKIIHCGEGTPEDFISSGSKIEVEFHSESIRNIPKFDFRVDHAEDAEHVRRQLLEEHLETSNFASEVPLQISTKEKPAIISLLIILPIALIIVGLLSIVLAKHMNGGKKERRHEELPTQCPQSKKFVQKNQSNGGDSTVLDFFLDNDKLTVKPGKVKLQDRRTEKIMSNHYADLPTSLEICTTVASQDIKPPPPAFDEKLVGFGSLM